MKKEGTRLKFWQASQNRWIFGVSLVLWASSLGFLLFRLFPSINGQLTVPLHYNVHVGIDKLGTWWQILIPAGVGLVVIILNLSLGQLFWRRSSQVTELIGWWTLGMTIILAIANAFLVVINLFYA